MIDNPFSGTLNLVQSVLNFMLTLVPVLAGALVAYHQIAKNAAGGDEVAAAHHNRATKSVLVSAVVAEVASGLVRWLLSFYQ